MNNRADLRKKIPYGGLRKIAKKANVSPKAVSEFFSGKTNSKKVALATVEILEEMKHDKELFEQRLQAAFI